jgi:hypothetical protein
MTKDKFYTAIQDALKRGLSARDAIEEGVGALAMKEGPFGSKILDGKTGLQSAIKCVCQAGGTMQDALRVWHDAFEESKHPREGGKFSSKQKASTAAAYKATEKANHTNGTYNNFHRVASHLHHAAAKMHPKESDAHAYHSSAAAHHASLSQPASQSTSGAALEESRASGAKYGARVSAVKAMNLVNGTSHKPWVVDAITTEPKAAAVR